MLSLLWSPSAGSNRTNRTAILRCPSVAQTRACCVAIRATNLSAAKTTVPPTLALSPCCANNITLICVKRRSLECRGRPLMRPELRGLDSCMYSIDPQHNKGRWIITGQHSGSCLQRLIQQRVRKCLGASARQASGAPRRLCTLAK